MKDVLVMIHKESRVEEEEKVKYILYIDVQLK